MGSHIPVAWRHLFRATTTTIATLACLVLSLQPAWGEDEDDEADDDRQIEEVVTTGTQIRGASISEALPVSVINAEEIEILGIDSGDELLDLIPENGQNFFSEAENISGGVNSARGDVGAFNLRSMGTGNTLVLLNGRRMVNLATFQTEEIGGSFVPVNTVNSNEIPVFGVDQLQVLRDGASAIYGADAVAGVVNTVLKKDFEGLTVRGKYSAYDNVSRDDQQVSVEWGKYLNNGATNVGVFLNHYRRDRVRADEDPRWADSDFRRRVPAGSPWEGDIRFRNDSANSLYGQFDLVQSAGGSTGLSANDYTDSAGDFETYPIGDPRCDATVDDADGWNLGYGTCAHEDGQGTFRYNLNEFRDLNSELERTTAFMFINHDMGNGTESFTELSVYDSKTNLRRHPSAPFSTVDLRIDRNNYWNPFGPVGSPNRINLPGTNIPASGMDLRIENYRFAELPRIIDNDGRTYRFLQGFRGSAGDLDWETAVLYSSAKKTDITHNRVSNTLAEEALADPTPAAYNPWSGGVDNNIERILIDVRRDGRTTLKSFDFKVSNNDIKDLPAGPVGLLVGFEWREESFIDDRDPRLDGTVVFTDWEGDTYPLVSDVVNSSPTPDNSGERNVMSVFTEFQVPVLDNLDLQLALRYESFSDVGRTAVPKVAFGWRPVEQLLVRGSWSEAFRAPNLVTVNEDIVARQNTRTDYTCLYAAENGGDPDQDTLDCVNSTQRIAQGSRDLVAEESDNFSVGLVYEPLEALTLTLDFWSITKEGSIGLFGEENHTLLDLLARLEQGNADCSSLMPNTAVNRAAITDPDEIAIYDAAGICPAGDIRFIDDRYANLDTRKLSGFDLGVYYNWDTRWGNFDFRYVGAFLSKYEQNAGAGSPAARLFAAQAAGLIPASFPIDGFGDLVQRDGNQETRQNFSLRWRNGDWGASVSGYRVGEFYQSSLTLDDGTRYTIPAMTTINTTVDKRFDWMDGTTRVRVGINNVFDERAPLADRFFGYFADAHRDLGRYYYVDVRASL